MNSAPFKGETSNLRQNGKTMDSLELPLEGDSSDASGENGIKKREFGDVSEEILKRGNCS